MAVAAASSHTVIVAEDGCAFACGVGQRGQLGTGNFANSLVPTPITKLPAPVRQVAAGWYHTAIVTEAGDLLMCGAGWDGRLGLGDEKDRATPTLLARAVFDSEAVLMVACGKDHTVVATKGGGVYTFGHGGEGRLGHGDGKNQLKPRRVPAERFRPNGSADGPDEQIVMVAAGGAHTVALSEAGRVFTWGYGECGQLGHNNAESQRAPRQVEAGRFRGEKVVFVAAGENHTAAVTAAGRLYTWGEGWSGQVWFGKAGLRLVPTLVGAGAFGGSAVVMAACGLAHTLVVTQDGALWACGRGTLGRLGLDDNDDRYFFERVGAGAFGGARVVAAAAGISHSAAVTEDGALWTWGEGGNGRLGQGDEQRRMVPTLVSGAGLGSGRIGRCRGLPVEHVLAFAMGTHGRLGGGESMQQACSQSRQKKSRCTEQLSNPTDPVDTSGKVLLLKEELVEMVCNMCMSWAKGVTTREEGLGRLIGAGFIPRSLWPRPTPMPKEINSLTVKVCRPCNIVFS